MAVEKQKDERLDRLENHQKFMKEKVEDIDQKVTHIYYAVVGNKSMGNIGIAERMQDLETEITDIKKEVKVLETEKIENAVYMRQIKRLSWAVVVLVLGFLFKEVFVK